MKKKKPKISKKRRKLLEKRLKEFKVTPNYDAYKDLSWGDFHT